MTPHTIGRYEVIAELGRGGMAVVYHAHDPQFKRDVAIKLMPREFLHVPDFKVRFKREAQTIAALEHDAIVPVYDFGEQDGLPYLVMRYMAGGSLAGRIARQPLTVDEVARIFRRIAPAIDTLHAQGLIHRDLKPDNILFDQQDNAHIADFGIAKLIHATSQLTGHGSLIGSPGYMSPEQIQDKGEVDHQTDIYALGVILYESVTGQMPFLVDSSVGYFSAHLHEPIPDILDVNPDLPPLFTDIIYLAMAKDKVERYQSAAEIAADVARSLSAVPDEASLPQGHRSHRPPATLPTGTITFLFTDIEGSTRLWEHHPDAMQHALGLHDDLLRQAIETHEGRLFKTMGDAFFAAFTSPTLALLAALDAQHALHSAAWDPAIGSLRVRMAVHTGLVEQQGDDYVGPPLNRLARLLSAGHGGQILLSRATQELVRDDLPSGVTLTDLGQHRLKDLFRPEHIFQVNAPDLTQKFAPLNTIDLKLTNLPAQTTPFIGRERELAAVIGLLHHDDVRLVTLTGPGGTGKTRLSLQAAADLLDEYEHGVWFVDLAPVTNIDRVPSAIASILNVAEVADEPLLDTLKQHLSDRQMLLVLDNYEQIVEAAPIVEDLLEAAPRLKVMVTSRELLRLSGEHNYAVPSLALPDLQRRETAAVISQYEAVALFIQRAKAVQPDFVVDEDNAPAVAEICVRLDGLPLAIELTAARVTLFSMDQLLNRLENRLKTVRSSLRNLPERQRTLRGAIDWSYDLLSDDEKKLFAWLSVFQGGRTLEAIEAVCGEGIDLDIDEGLESLIHKSLLRRSEGQSGEPRFVMLETLHEYARERLAEGGQENEIRLRHTEFFRDLGKRAEPAVWTGDFAEWVPLMEDETSNFLSALEWTLGGHDIELGIRLLLPINWYWYMTGKHELFHEWVQRGLSHLDLLPADLRASLNMQAGYSYWSVYEVERSRQFHQKALDLFRELDNASKAARTLINLGSTTIGQKHLYEQALAWIEEGTAYALEVEDDNLVSYAQNVLGEVARNVGDYDRAKEAYEESLRLAQKTQSRLRECIMYHNLSIVAHKQEDYIAARDHARSAIILGHEIHHTFFTAEAFHRVGAAIGMLGQPERGIRLHGASEAVRDSIGARIQTGDLEDYERGLNAIRSLVDAATFDKLWDEGRAMSFEDAIAYALQDD